MSARIERLRPGDLVELRSPDEIAKSLDADGALDGLPFMPEMLDFFGRRLQVGRRALTVCYYGPGSYRGFPADDVVTLEDVRCSGAAHDGCQKACTIFWREAWLRRSAEGRAPEPVDPADVERLRRRLKVATGPATYYCQASELLKATSALPRTERALRFAKGLRVGNFGLVDMAASVATYMELRLRKLSPRGVAKRTPAESLNLQAGEWVEVKPLESIVQTLDAHGRNRGLSFSADMRLMCGRKLRVKGRLEKLISDGTGEMKTFYNTVCLEGSTCGCAYVGAGMSGCARCELTYWREIWLSRCDGPE